MRRTTAILILLALACACTGNGHWLPPIAGESGRRITPGVFAFKDINPAPKNEPGGWRAVCLHANVGQSDPQGHICGGGVCKFEIGVPIVNVRGYVDRRHAQDVAADTGNKAAYFVLERIDLAYITSATLCNMIKAEWDQRIRREIIGAMVTSCVTRNAPVVHWP